MCPSGVKLRPWGPYKGQAKVLTNDRKDPWLSKTWMRELPQSATKMLSWWSTAMPVGALNCPFPSPLEPKQNRNSPLWSNTWKYSENTVSITAFIFCWNWRNCSFRNLIRKVSSKKSKKSHSVWKWQKKSHSTLRAKASNVYILSGQKLIKNVKKAQFWRVFKNLAKLPDMSVLVGQKLVKNAKFPKIWCDILGWFSNTMILPIFLEFGYFSHFAMNQKYNFYSFRNFSYDA